MKTWGHGHADDTTDKTRPAKAWNSVQLRVPIPFVIVCTLTITMSPYHDKQPVQPRRVNAVIHQRYYVVLVVK